MLKYVRLTKSNNLQKKIKNFPLYLKLDFFVLNVDHIFINFVSKIFGLFLAPMSVDLISKFSNNTTSKKKIKYSTKRRSNVF